MRTELRFLLALVGWLAACSIGSMGAAACAQHTPPPVEPEPPASAIPAPVPRTGAASDAPAASPAPADRASKLGSGGGAASSGPLKVPSLDAPNENQPSAGPSYVEKRGVVTPPAPAVTNSGGKSTPPPPAPLGGN